MKDIQRKMFASIQKMEEIGKLYKLKHTHWKLRYKKVDTLVSLPALSVKMVVVLVRQRKRAGARNPILGGLSLVKAL